MIPSICHNKDLPIVISAYTTDSHLGNYYQKASVRLSKSLNKYNITHMIYAMTPIKNWVQGCSFKPKIIQHALKSFNQPILWIDADGEVNQYPKIFEKPNFDMALVAYNGHWLTGTLYFNTKCTKLIDDWVNKTSKDEPDEITLLKVHRHGKYDLKCEMLPRPYNEIVHKKTDMSKVVIGHYIRPDIAPSRGLEVIKL